MSSPPQQQRRSGLSAAARRQAKSKKKATNGDNCTAVTTSVPGKTAPVKELMVLILAGVSGSGKSWLSNKIKEELGTDVVFISSRDELRKVRYHLTDESLVEYHQDPCLRAKEGAITGDQDAQLKQIAEDPDTPYSLIIIDDTNLRIDYIIERCRAFYTGTRIKFLPIHCTREESDVNQNKRVRQVPCDVVDNQLASFSQLMLIIKRDAQVKRYLGTQLNENITAVLRKWVPKSSQVYIE